MTQNGFQPDRLQPVADGKSPDFMAGNFLDPTTAFRQLPPELHGWVRLYLRLQVEGVKAPSTAVAVTRDLAKFETFFAGYYPDLDLRRWVPQTTRRFVEALGDRGLRPATVMRTLVSLRSFAHWLRGLRSDFFPLGDPTRGIKSPTQAALQPRGLEERDVKRVLDAAYRLICQTYPDAELGARHRPGHRCLKRPYRDFAIVMLLLNGGLRRSEVCDLDADQLQERHLRGIKCKGNLYRDVLLGEETLKAIRVYRERERVLDADAYPVSPALFLPTRHRRHRNTSGRLSVRTVNTLVNRIAAEANKGRAPSDRLKLHPHRFRHTHAYRILKNGRSLPYLQKRLGHQSMQYLSRYAQMPESEEKTLLDEVEFT